MKKNDLLQKFVLFAFNYKSRTEYQAAAWRTIHAFGIENGVVIDDFEISDFEGTSIGNKRREQIFNRIKKDEAINDSMIVDYCVYVGGKILKKITEENTKARTDGAAQSKLVKCCFSLSRKTDDILRQFSEKCGRSKTEIIEEALNYCFDSEK